MSEKKDIIKSLAIHKKDVGSAAVQIGLLSDKINKLSEHFKKFKKDKHSSRGLTKSVNRRKRLLAYLSKSDPELYNNILKKLKLRK
jgi:small subunit ribosomal protein S15